MKPFDLKSALDLAQELRDLDYKDLNYAARLHGKSSVMIEQLVAEIRSYQRAAESLSQALNSGSGVYKP